MQRIIRRFGIAGVIPLAITAVVGGGALIALADDGTAEPQRSSSLLSRFPFLANEDGPTEVKRVEGSLKAGDLDRYLEKLAAKLGVSEDALREAMKQSGLELLDEAVANGDVSQEQADQLRKAIEASDMPFFGGGFALGGGLGVVEFGHVEGDMGSFPFEFGLPIHKNGALAEFLGITQDQLHEELNSGKSLAQVGESHGKSRETMKGFLVEQQDSALAAATAAGKITESHAAEAREKFAEHVEGMLDGQMRIHIEEGGVAPGFLKPFSQSAPGRPGLPEPFGDDDSDDSADDAKTY